MQPDPWTELPGPPPARTPPVSTGLLFTIIISGFICVVVGLFTALGVIIESGPEIGQQAATLQAGPTDIPDPTGTASALSTQAADATLPANARPLLREDFASRKNGWLNGIQYAEVGRSTGIIESGHYKLDVAEDTYENYWWSLPERAGQLPPSFYISVDAFQSSGDLDSGYGLIFNFVSDGKGAVVFEIADNGFAVVEAWGDGNETVGIDWQPAPVIRKAGWNQLVIRSEDGLTRFYVNRMLVHATDEIEMGNGYAGVVISSYDVGYQSFQFDNFNIYALEE